MAGELRSHCRRRAALAALAGLPGPPAVVVVRQIHGRGGGEVFELLGEAVGQSVEPLHKQAGGSVEPFDMGSANRELVYPAAYNPALGADYLVWVVLHVGVLVLFYDDA